MELLIAYYSFSENNEKLARELQARTGADICKINEIKRRTPLTILLDIIFNRSPRIEKRDPLFKNYQHIILIAPIWAGKIASPLRTFIKTWKAGLKDYSFISLCGRSGNSKVPRQLEDLTGRKPLACRELAIEKLLAQSESDSIRNASAYKIKQTDLARFDDELDEFLPALLEKQDFRL